MILGQLESQWRAENVGKVILTAGSAHVCSFAWADNLYLVARSASENASTITSAQTTHGEHGMPLDREAMLARWSDGDNLPQPQIDEAPQANGLLGERRKVQDVPVFDMTLRMDPAAAVRARLHRIAGAYLFLRPLIQQPEVPRAHEVETYSARTQPVALRGGNAWTLIQSTITQHQVGKKTV